MKIVQIVTQMEAGGAQKVAALLGDGLREKGHDAQLWFLYKKRPAYAESFSIRCLAPARPSSLGWFTVAARLYSRLREAQPDVVLTHTHSANTFAAPIAALAGVSTRIAVHHNPVQTYPRVASIADKLVFRLGSYSSMVTVSGGVTHSFASHTARYRSRLHRIYNGIFSTASETATDVRANYRIPPEHALLVNVGRLAKQKNQGVLLTMLKQIPNATLLLVGDGELGIELRQLAYRLGIAGRVRFTGELPSQKVAAILQQADLFLLPSRYESFCLAAMEAMQHGLPVVASDLPCLREVLGDSQLFFQLDDAHALTTIVKRLMHCPEEREAMGAAGRLRAQRFSIERMVEEYELLMREAMLYTARRKSAANDFRGLNTLRGIPRVHDQL